MRYYSLPSVALTAYAFLTTAVHAQTYSSCNPLYKTCPANAALPATQDTTFAGASSLPAGWSTVNGALSYDANGANFVVARQGQSPTIQSAGYFLFGYCEVKMKAASGQGMVTSIVLESDDLDEVDWELVGGNRASVQSNYFGKGDTSTYDRSIWHPVAAPQDTWHTYAINWTSTSLTWLIDGVAIRTLNYADAQAGARYPQTPMRLKLGIWAGGDPSNSDGTIAWAGGRTDFAQAPFTMSVASVRIVNYAPATSYTYGDNSGSWQSINIAGGAYNPLLSSGVAAPAAPPVSPAPLASSSAPAPAPISSAVAPPPASSASTTGSAGRSSISKSIVDRVSTRSSIISATTMDSPEPTTLATVVASSNSGVFQVSTASLDMSTSTAGATTTSAPAFVPLSNATLTSLSVGQNATRTSALRAAATQTANAAAPAIKGLSTGLIMALAGLGSALLL